MIYLFQATARLYHQKESIKIRNADRFSSREAQRPLTTDQAMAGTSAHLHAWGWCSHSTHPTKTKKTTAPKRQRICHSSSPRAWTPKDARGLAFPRWLNTKGSFALPSSKTRSPNSDILANLLSAIGKSHYSGCWARTACEHSFACHPKQHREPHFQIH